MLARTARAARDLLVVTDKYPPHTVGGAELSLHIVMRRPAFRDRALVAMFSREVAEPSLYRQDDVPVIVLPEAAPWPLQRRGFAAFDAARAAGRAARRRFELAEGARFLKPRSFGDLIDRIAALGYELLGRPRGGVATDFSDTTRNFRHRALTALTDVVRPRAILLDNYRSIMLAPTARAAPGVERVAAVVRDNRFHCMRFDQSLMIDGVRCQSCALQCAGRDAPRTRLFHRRHLAGARRRRLAALNSADVVVVTSGYLERSLAPEIRSAELRRVANPGDELGEVAESIRGVGEWPGAHLALVGMLNEAKGQLPFVEAAGQWLRADPARMIHLAGRGDRTARLIEAAAAREGVADQVALHGYLTREAVLRLMRAAQIVVAPTLWPEPFGRVPLEAGLVGRPIVAFRRGGLSETILDGETGYLVEPGDYARFLARVDALLADPKRRLEMGARARAHVASLYSAGETEAKLAAALFDDAGPAGA